MQIIRATLQEIEEIQAKEGTIHGAFYMSEEDYHAAPGWSSSVLTEPTVSRKMAAYAGKRKVEPSEAMKLGSATHCFIFEPEEFQNRYAVMPAECDGLPRNKNAENGGCKEAWDAFKGSVGRKDVLTRDQWNAITGMRDSLERHKEAREMIFSPLAYDELVVFWKCPYSGLQCRAKLDSFLPGKGVLDLKTTSKSASPDSFWRNIQYGFDGKLGYWVQAAHYTTGAKVVFGGDKVQPTFLWAVAETQYPYDFSLLQLGRERFYNFVSDYALMMKELAAAPMEKINNPYGTEAIFIGVM